MGGCRRRELPRPSEVAGRESCSLEGARGTAAALGVGRRGGWEGGGGGGGGGVVGVGVVMGGGWGCGGLFRNPKTTLNYQPPDHTSPQMNSRSLGGAEKRRGGGLFRNPKGAETIQKSGGGAGKGYNM